MLRDEHSQGWIGESRAVVEREKQRQVDRVLGIETKPNAKSKKFRDENK